MTPKRELKLTKKTNPNLNSNIFQGLKSFKVLNYSDVKI